MDHDGLSRIVMDDGLSCAIMDYRGLWTKIVLSWILDYYSIIVNVLHRGFGTIMVYHGLSWIMDYRGVSSMTVLIVGDSKLLWIIMEYGLSWIIMDYGLSCTMMHHRGSS